MLLPADQRRLLGAFLRARREALSPAEAGLPAAGRRRTPGLRREEVAQLSGLSTTWYSWAEQGRDIAFSEAALARLAGALRLTAAERSYLFELTRRRDPAVVGPMVTAEANDFGALLESVSVPAYAMDRFWTVRAWNAPAARLFAPWFATGEMNLLRYVFLDPGAAQFIRDWDDRARRVIAEFRADTAAEPDNPTLQALLRDLSGGSPIFAHLWKSQTVLAREGGVRGFAHPVDGPLTFRQVTLVPTTSPRHKLVMLLPLAPEDLSSEADRQTAFGL